MNSQVNLFLWQTPERFDRGPLATPLGLGPQSQLKILQGAKGSSLSIIVLGMFSNKYYFAMAALLDSSVFSAICIRKFMHGVIFKACSLHGSKPEGSISVEAYRPIKFPIFGLCTIVS